jgi:hypothetical protein
MVLPSLWFLIGTKSVLASLFYKSLFQALNTKLALSKAYPPQTDGRSERVNQCLEMYLRCCSVHDNPTKWKKWLALAEFWYNSAYHTLHYFGLLPF